ncbi:MAG: Uma2 family endonuclease [Actinobacteria bacterium]|nr:Uma2 family endonuclease [Actinomycetota bacterium]
MAKTAESASDLLTVEDVWAMPDDGRRRELIDGVLIVSPSPRLPHQRVATRLVGLLLAACPDELEVFAAPLDWVISDTTLLQPDVIVARKADYAPHGPNLRKAPVFVVEVRSPSTARYDAGTKRLAYEAAGAQWYWMVDPDGPGLVVLELVDGAYREVARVSDDEPYDATAPFAVRVVPADLVRV